MLNSGGWDPLAIRLVCEDWNAALNGEDAPPLTRANNISRDEYRALRTMPHWMIKFNGATSSREVWAEWASTQARLAAWAAVGAPVISPREPDVQIDDSPAEEELFWWE